jgi:DNA repair photolyase
VAHVPILFYNSGMQDKDETLLPGQRLRARGVASNALGRFEGHARLAVDDGWDIPHEERLVATEVRVESPRSAINYVKSPDLGFDRSINPYRGCEHGCVYCYARPSHAFLGMSAGLDFETRLVARPGIDLVLRKELRAKAYQVAPIALGTNTDPYQPVEAEYGVTRSILQVLQDCDHPVTVTTRGTLVERDLDLLAPMAAKGLAAVAISVTTLDAGLARAMEPRAPAPARRLAVIRRLAEAGIPVRVQVSPMVPGLTDHELEAILEAAKEAGAGSATSIMLRLPLEVSGLFRDWVEARFPDRAARVMARVRDLHGGQDYDPAFGTRMTGTGIWADLHRQRMEKARARLGLGRGVVALRCDLFRVPGADARQLNLF